MKIVSPKILIQFDSNDDCFVDVLCAICVGLNDQLILTMPTVNTLKQLARNARQGNDDDNKPSQPPPSIGEDSHNVNANTAVTRSRGDVAHLTAQSD